MNAFVDFSCPKCRKRFGTVSVGQDEVACPRCGRVIDLRQTNEQLRAARDELFAPTDLNLVRGRVYSVDGHLFAVGDLEIADESLYLQYCRWRGQSATAMYTSPPFSRARLSQWHERLQGRARVDEAEPRELLGDLEWVMRGVVRAAKLIDGPCVVEVGDESLEILVSVIDEDDSLVIRAERPAIVYGHGVRAYLAVIAAVDNSSAKLDEIVVELAGRTQTEAPRLFAALLGDDAVIFDPCTGLGYTQLQAEKSGHKSIGMELLPDRLRRAIELVADHTGCQPKLVGNFLEHSHHA